MRNGDLSVRCARSMRLPHPLLQRLQLLQDPSSPKPVLHPVPHCSRHNQRTSLFSLLVRFHPQCHVRQQTQQRMSVPLSFHPLARHARDDRSALMPRHLFLGIWQPSSKLMIPPAPKMRTVHLHQVPHQQRHLVLLCHSIATQHPHLLHLGLPSQQRHRDWNFRPDQSHLGAQAEFPSLLLGSQPIICGLHRAVPHSLGLLLTQPSLFQRSPSLPRSLLWSLTLDPIL